MSTIRVDQIEDIAGTRTSAVDELVSESTILTTETGSQTLVEALNSRASKEGFSAIQSVAMTVYIPTDYATLQEAVDDLSTLSVGQGALIDLVIESGHQPASGVIVNDGDYGYFRISSEDATVTASGYFRLTAYNARCPILNCFVDLTASTGFDSYHLSNASSGYIMPGAGMSNGDRGMHVENASICMADQSVFTGFQQAGCHASRNSKIECSSAVFSGNNLEGSTFGAVYASRNSEIHGQYIDVTNSVGVAVRAQRFAKIACPEVDISGAQGTGFLATLGGEIFCASGSFTANNMQGEAIICQDGRVVVSGDFVCSNSFSGTAVECTAGTVNWSGNISGYSGLIIQANEGGIVSCPATTISSGSIGMRAEQGGRISGRSSTITNMSSVGAYAARGGFIEIADGSVTGSGGDDLAIERGSMIVASECSTSSSTGSPSTADTNVSTFNSISSNKGIIWN